ncbi:helix-turn-helix transcriptional regulator [Enterobacillus tribolii]|uniref:Two-component system capsular synthesis response regulator RcsB n=1 Tax=Enterobacillus tribolii TaxID=1487935 RepID=A0A370QQ41_9GAMM|nr:LuxR C-terminal-related transcriptional regulator [Enterobacillus tribolii]MBW7981539.1 response regulator transcription factor [Enterobacillus tribolii]RDK90916.1 two-component system capsular synthesis response regulator RcsB [Enterobacillus tribolii]
MTAGKNKEWRIIIMYPCVLTRRGLERFFAELLPNAQITSLNSFAALSANSDLATADLIVSDITDREEHTLRGAEWLLWLQRKIRPDKPIMIATQLRYPTLLSHLAQEPTVSLISLTEPREVLSKQVTQILNGEKIINLNIDAEKGNTRPPAQKKRAALTESERRVLSLLRAGYSVTQIANQQERSVKTISTHKRRIMQKFGAKSEVELFARDKAGI